MEGPKILLRDEPANSLDPEALKAFLDMIQQL